VIIATRYKKAIGSTCIPIWEVNAVRNRFADEKQANSQPVKHWQAAIEFKEDGVENADQEQREYNHEENELSLSDDLVSWLAHHYRYVAHSPCNSEKESAAGVHIHTER